MAHETNYGNLQNPASDYSNSKNSASNYTNSKNPASPLGIITIPEVTIIGKKPKVGEAYDSPDEAAEAAMYFIIEKSIKEQLEYAGWIYKNLLDNKFYFTKPNKGTKDDSSPGNAPSGMTKIATYHTHGGRAKGIAVITDEIFSPQDKLKATLGKHYSYLGTPKRKILKFTPVDLLAPQAQARYPSGFVEILIEF